MARTGFPKAIAFDAYGTLFDVYSVGALAEELFPGQGRRLTELWRIAQIDYTRLRTLSGRHADFARVTEDALRFSARTLGLEMTAEKCARLMAQYQELTAFPEVAGVLAELKQKGFGLAILSNGTPEMIAGAAGAAGLTGSFDHLISIEAAGKYKTAPEAYRLATTAFGCEAGDILFVSSNGWDVCGAGWFGFKTFWVNRAGGELEYLGVTPDSEGRNLNDLLAFVSRAAG